MGLVVVLGTQAGQRESAATETTGPAAGADLPATSLIICSRNRPELLAAAVESVLRGDEVPTEFIVVDQSDVPHPNLPTLTTDRDVEIRYIWTRTVGLSRANNVGVAAARHDLLAFIHDDVRATPAWFGSLIRALLRVGPRGVVTGRVLPDEAEIPGGFVPTLKVDEAPAIYEGRVGEDVLYPLNMAMYRSAIGDVGNFDERLGPGTAFPSAEDNDFGLRLLEAGYRIAYVPEAALYHRAWRNDRLRLRWSYGRGQGAYYAKHLSVQDRYMLRRFARDIVRRALGVTGRLSHDRHRAYGEALYLLGLLTGALQWLLTQPRTR